MEERAVENQLDMRVDKSQEVANPITMVNGLALLLLAELRGGLFLFFYSPNDLNWPIRTGSPSLWQFLKPIVEIAFDFLDSSVTD